MYQISHARTAVTEGKICCGFHTSCSFVKVHQIKRGVAPESVEGFFLQANLGTTTVLSTAASSTYS